MNRRARWATPLALLLLALVLLTSAGCGADRVVTRRDDPAVSSAPDEAATGDPTSVTAARKAAGIADCGPVDRPAAAQGLPEVTLPCLGSEQSVTMSGLRGPMVLNVWAQWCPPCREEAPILAEVSQQAQGRVAFLGVVYSDPRLDYSVEFARQAGWRYPQVVDNDRRLQIPLSIAGPPRTVLIDADGRVVDQLAGEIASADQLRERIRTKLGVDLG